MRHARGRSVLFSASQLVATVAAVILLISVTPADAGKKFAYYRVGNADDAVAAVSGGIVLMGGGTDVDAAFRWMCDRSKGGDFLVIRAAGTDAYNPYIQALCPAANSVATLIVPSVSGANDAFVIDTLQKAEAIFIAGGDQSNYINYWKGTALQGELDAAVSRGVPLGGTSAGMMVLTQFIYSAQASQGVTSSQALADPFNRYISLDRDLVAIPLLSSAIGDSHFAARDRMGRDLAFMCRVAANGWAAAPRSISIDQETALLIALNGSADVVGGGSAYFLRAPGAAQVCQPGTPLTYRDIEVQRVGASGTFNLSTWRSSGAVRYTVSAEAGVLTSSQAGGSIY
jgi:cyanophycinase